MTEELDFLEKAAARYMRFTLKRSHRAIAQKLGVKPSTIRRYQRPVRSSAGWQLMASLTNMPTTII